MDTAALFQYNSIRDSEFFSLSGVISGPVGGKVVVHKVLDHSVPEVVASSREHKHYFFELFSLE